MSIAEFVCHLRYLRHLRSKVPRLSLLAKIDDVQDDRPNSLRTMSDADALALVMEMMAIPGRSGEEAAIMDFIRGKLIEAGVTASALSRSTMPTVAHRSAARSAIWF